MLTFNVGPGPVGRGFGLYLTATAAGNPTSVNFYLDDGVGGFVPDTGHDQFLVTGVEIGPNIWVAPLGSAALPADFRVWAQASNTDGSDLAQAGATIVASQPPAPVVTALTVAPSAIYAGQTVDVYAAAFPGTSGLTSVGLYQDEGNGVYDGTEPFLGSMSGSPGGGHLHHPHRRGRRSQPHVLPTDAGLEQDNPIVSFHRVRENEPHWLSEQNYQREVAEGKVIVFDSGR